MAEKKNFVSGKLQSSSKKQLRRRQSFSLKKAEKIKNDNFEVGRRTRQLTNELILYLGIKLGPGSKKIYMELYDAKKMRYVIDHSDEIPDFILRKFRDKLIDQALLLNERISGANTIFPGKTEPIRSLDLGIRRRIQDLAIGTAGSLINLLNSMIVLCPHQLKGLVHFSSEFSGLLKGIREWRNYLPGEKDQKGNKIEYPKSSKVSDDFLKAEDESQPSAVTADVVTVDQVDNLKQNELYPTLDLQSLIIEALNEKEEYQKEQAELKKESEKKKLDKKELEKEAQEKIPAAVKLVSLPRTAFTQGGK